MTEREQFLHTLKRLMTLAPETFERRIKNWSWTHKPSDISISQFFPWEVKVVKYGKPDWTLSVRESVEMWWAMKWTARYHNKLRRKKKRERQEMPQAFSGLLSGFNDRETKLPF